MYALLYINKLNQVTRDLMNVHTSAKDAEEERQASLQSAKAQVK